ncbi:glycosyltransferase [Dyadobacter diqingensis]|uniref:glycosyltransferase n=1 Tax=Dyadobacter diqingensis TaxID=2938121 RepID=UPI0020C532C4|nr:glycosyltransferase [Dyadobacter diqingensis]
MKLRGQQIIIFGLPRFDSEIESTSYTSAKLLARENFVYYVENPFTIRDYFNLRKGREFEIRKGHFSLQDHKLIDTEVPNLKIIIPPILASINFLPEGKVFRAALKVNEYLIRYKLKKVIASYKLKDFIFINSFNFHYPNISKGLHPRLTVYHCLDPMALPFNLRHGVVSERILVEQSDVVICSSRQLFVEKKEQNPGTYFVANAADLEHSSKALNPALPVFPEIAKLKSPVIGYFGAIERRMDYNLLREVVKRNSEKTFVFVGPVSSEFVPDDFYDFPNLVFLGPVEYADMPAVIKGFDVALIPFKKDDISHAIFPLKLFEYLGAGKPVVAIDFNKDLAEFTKGSVDFCADPESFSNAINLALETDSSELRENRVAIAAENTWEIRIREIADLIDDHLKK